MHFQENSLQALQHCLQPAGAASNVELCFGSEQAEHDKQYESTG